MTEERDGTDLRLCSSKLIKKQKTDSVDSEQKLSKDNLYY